jgi:hypothetical protein
MKFVLQPIKLKANKTRFSLRFTDKTLAVKENAIINGNDIVISHQKNSNTLAVHNSSTDIIIERSRLI